MWGDKLTRATDINEVVIIIANDGDQGSGRTVGDELTIVGDAQPIGPASLIFAEVDFTARRDDDLLTTLQTDFSTGPICRGGDVDCFLGRGGAGCGIRFRRWMFG